MCGSTDLVKDGDYYVCQYCGAKYTAEAAKKLMVEGTVKIDTSDEVNNLYELARRAAKDGNTAKAQQYYEQIVLKKPDDWEASYFSVYYQCTNCRVGELKEAANQLRNTNDSVLMMVATSEMNAEEIHDAVLDIINSSVAFASMVRTNVKQNEYILPKGDLIGYMSAAYGMLYVLGNIVESYYIAYTSSNASKFEKITQDMFFSCWKSAINLEHDMIYSFIIDTESRKKHRDHMEEFANRIRKYDSSYQTPEVFIRGETKGKGCYIATCVYGSYECPQVWTLRRYRDDTLGATWYGRTFIRIYYAISPTLVKWFGKTKWFKKMWQGKLDRMVKNLNDKGVENTPYQDKQW